MLALQLNSQRRVRRRKPDDAKPSLQCSEGDGRQWCELGKRRQFSALSVFLSLCVSASMIFLCSFLIYVFVVVVCRDSHSTAGPFNSIPRMPQMTTNRDPEQKIASYYPAWNNLTRNFIIANYHSDDGMDHDGVSHLFLWHTRPPVSLQTTVTLFQNISVTRSQV